MRFVEVEEGEVGIGARRAEIRRRRMRGREAVGVGEGGAFGAGDSGAIRGILQARMGIEKVVVEKMEAQWAEGGRVEAEDAGGAEHAVDAAKTDVVEDGPTPGPTLGGPTVAAL